MSTNSKSPDVEWVGGLVRVPAYVLGENPYRPDALFWIDAEGEVLHSSVARPGELLSGAAEDLRTVIAESALELGLVPTRVRVASHELASALRTVSRELEIVCAPTPEIDALKVMIREKFAQDAATEQSYLRGGHEPAVMAKFFEAAAACYRTQPWDRVPSDQHLFVVTIEELGLQDAVLSIVGQLGQSVGFVLFASRADFEAYLDAGDALAHGQIPTMAPHLALNFERGSELSSSLRKEIARYGWEVAGATAYPWLMAMDEELVARPPTATELNVATVLACALPIVLEGTASAHALSAAWSGGAPLVSTHAVETAQARLVSITVRVEALPGVPTAAAAVPLGVFEPA